VADTTYGTPTESFGTDVPSSSTAGAAERVREEAARLGRRAVDAVESGRSGAARGIHSTAEGLRSAADRLPGGPKVRQFASQAADRLDHTADYLRERDARQILSDLEEQTKAHPVPFLIGALALGFVAGRLMRRG
jgi:hypothetical protein